MVHSHHSHLGQYVAHAVDLLDSMVELAYIKGFTTFCLTEHMPRLDYLYPEEIDRHYTISKLFTKFERYIGHAKRLKLEYGRRMTILVGFEVEGINEDHLELAQRIRAHKDIDMCVGSVHFVDEIPIDFDRNLWVEARNQCGGNRALWKRYFETQYEMIKKVKPEVVGHFDLIRLYAEPGEEPDKLSAWPEVWQQVQTNIDLIIAQGGLIELNSSAIRKGWLLPYPKEDIAQEILIRGGRFCLSDDSHSLKQVGLNYGKVLDYVESLGVQHLYELREGGTAVEVAVTDVRQRHEDNLVSEDAWKRFELKK